MGTGQFGSGCVEYSAGLGQNYDWSDRWRPVGNSAVVLAGQWWCLRGNEEAGQQAAWLYMQSLSGFRGLVKAGCLGYLWTGNFWAGKTHPSPRPDQA